MLPAEELGSAAGTPCSPEPGVEAEAAGVADLLALQLREARLQQNLGAAEELAYAW